MKSNIITLFASGALFVVLNHVCSKVDEISSKYLALNQFNNSEADFQIFNNLHTTLTWALLVAYVALLTIAIPNFIGVVAKLINKK